MYEKKEADFPGPSFLRCLKNGPLPYLHLPKRKLRRLQMVMNRCARMIFGLKWTARVTDYLKSRLHWLPAAARIDYKILLMVFKALAFNQPEYLCDSLVNTRRETRLKEHKAKKGRAFIRRSFHHSAPRLYNKIPSGIKKLKTSPFKKNLKTFFYRNNIFEKKMESLLDPTQESILKNCFNPRKQLMYSLLWIPESRGEKRTLNQLNLTLTFEGV